MVEFEGAKVPRLRLPTGEGGLQHAIHTRKLPFDAMADSATLTPKIGSPTGEYGKPDFAKGRVPGYAGHLPGIISSNPSGKTFGYLTRMDRDELGMGSPIGFAHAASPGPWASTYRRHYTEDGPRPEAFQPPHTARDPSLTTTEDRILRLKLKVRKRDGEQELRQLRLTSPTRVGMRTKPSWVVESGWITSRTNRLSKPKVEVAQRPCSPEGRRPGKRPGDDWETCAEYLRTLGFGDRFDADLDKVYAKWDPNQGYSAGELYETPKGWLGFGLRVAEKDVKKDIYRHWHTVYYPCPAEFLPTVLATGECVMPGDKLIDGTMTKTCFVTMKYGVEKRDPQTPRKLGAATRICTSPSIRYAHLKLKALTRNGGFIVHGNKRLSFVLQCKQMGGAITVGGYHRAEEQIGFTESQPKGTRISPFFRNEDLENYTLRKSSVVPYRVLVKVENAVFMPAWTSTGDPLMVPEQSPKDLKWTRTLAPAYAAQAVLGLTGPFTEFNDETVLKTTREGGRECPKVSVPFLTYPEKEPIKDRKTHPALRASTQPMEPEALVKPSSGWVEGYLPASFKNPGRNKGRSVQGIMAEMKQKFSANLKSLDNLFKSLAQHGDGSMHKSDLAVILVRMNILQDFDDPILEELWQTLDSDGGGSVDPGEFSAKFGLFGTSEGVMDVLKTKIGARFSQIGKAFRLIDEDKSGSVSRAEFLKLMRDWNLLDGFPKGSDEEIWELLDRDGSGELTYDEFVEKFTGGKDINIEYGPLSGTRVLVRANHQKEGSTGHTVAAMCDEGTACYAQQDWDKAEACYRKALALNPNHVVTLCCLAWLLLNHKNDVLAARGLMQRASDIDPHHPYLVWQRHNHL